MKIALIITTPDYAGLNIKDKLLKVYNFKKTGEEFEGVPVLKAGIHTNELFIYTTNTRCVDCEDYDKRVEADLFVFPTTHRARSGINSLSVHVQGNWGKAELGGRDRKLVPAPASIMKVAYQELYKLGKDTDYDIVNEVTHHGPYIEKPCFFIEIGSSEKQWKDPLAGEIIAKTLINTFSKDTPYFRVAIGLGGLHTCPSFNRIILETDVALGQICPKYNLHNFDEEMLKQAVEKTVEKVDFALLDWKGLGAEKERILKLLNNNKIKYYKTKQIK
ncbi:hypothetical protein D6745_02160 [Candidatus Woesearchaeota archaeon]|nr:MAG: hypothetical protein D6745_02160 [Candidatus Woesearchaeota archaeon]